MWLLTKIMAPDYGPEVEPKQKANKSFTFWVNLKSLEQRNNSEPKDRQYAWTKLNFNYNLIFHSLINIRNRSTIGVTINPMTTVYTNMDKRPRRGKGCSKNPEKWPCGFWKSRITNENDLFYYLNDTFCIKLEITRE